jgi:hypothetical protein
MEGNWLMSTVGRSLRPSNEMKLTSDLSGIPLQPEQRKVQVST